MEEAEFASVRAAEQAWAGGSLLLCCTGAGVRMRGDLMLAAEFATEEIVNTLLTAGRGILCLALDGPLFDRLGLLSTAPGDTWANPNAPVATATVDARSDVTTGISAGDRARTIAAAIRPDAGPMTVDQPGHVPVLRAAPEDSVSAAPPSRPPSSSGPAPVPCWRAS